jgi:RNA polymerase sigma-70 factor, ECF subfamily
VTDADWISAALTAARPQAVAALLRYFRDLDTAEEAFQEACLRALKSWPRNGPPRDTAAWLIMVGKNAAIDGVRKQARERPMPPEELVSDLSDAESALVERVDEADYRDDILRLLFVCCHPALPATQQIALALRIVSGLSVTQIARAFLVSEAAMEQRITRAKTRVAAAQVPFTTPGAVERSERLAAVAAMVYLIFNEGYTTNVAEHGARAPLCEEAIRLSRLLLRLFPAEPEIMGLAALLLLQHARAPARFDANGAAVLLEEQNRALWNRTLIAEGLALIDKAVRHRSPGPYQAQAAVAALHARAATPMDTDWAGIEQLYGALERMQPSPVVTLNRAVAASKVRGAADALAMIEPLASKLGGYFYYHGARGAFLHELGRAEEARVAFDRAITLANTPAEAAHIRSRIDQLLGDGRAGHADTTLPEGV